MNTEPEPISSVPPAAPAAPVAESRRITLLDALRGLSILGIAVVNVQFFACPVLRLMSWRWDQVPRSEAFVRAAITFFAEHHFFSIFSILFGMGLALQYQRVQEAGERFGGLYFRRLFVLLAFGIAHGILLWYGDILALYALVGFIVFWFRNASSKTLLISAIVIFMVPVMVKMGLTLHQPNKEVPSLVETKNNLIAGFEAEIKKRSTTQTAPSDAPPGEPPATQRARATAEDAETKKAIAFNKLLIRFINWMADDTRIYQSGSYREMLLHRLACFAMFSPGVAVDQMGWRALALMLFGIYLFRRGLFCTSRYPNSVYRRLTLIGLLIGLTLQTTGTLIHARAPNVVWALNYYFICIYLGSMGMALGYMGMVYLLYQHACGRRCFQPLVAVGRMSLTDYIGTSLLFGWIFYGYGLGLIGQVTFFEAELWTAGVLAFLVLFSVVWLKIFQIGPLEWLWRTLTYLRFVPLFRRRA